MCWWMNYIYIVMWYIFINEFFEILLLNYVIFVVFNLILSNKYEMYNIFYLLYASKFNAKK